MATSYKNMVKMLHNKYPGKHIYINKSYLCYGHAGVVYKTEYSVYVEDDDSNFELPTFSEVEKYVKYLCSKEV